MYNYKLTLQYDGTRYAGWQIQENALSIQEEIKNSIEQIIRENINLIGAGRTDAGVHALGQVANFKSEKNLEAHKLKYSLNSVLPDDISVAAIENVDEEFHARFSAKRRSYIYLISKSKSPFYDRYSHSYYSELDPEKLNQISDKLRGTIDFSSFRAGMITRVSGWQSLLPQKQENLLNFHFYRIWDVPYHRPT